MQRVDRIAIGTLLTVVCALAFIGLVATIGAWAVLVAIALVWTYVRFVER